VPVSVCLCVHRAVGVQTLLDMLTDHFWLDDPPGAHASAGTADSGLARVHRVGVRSAEGAATDPHTEPPVRTHLASR
jgi:hypothetical protein